MRLVTWADVHAHLAATYSKGFADRDGVLDVLVPVPSSGSLALEVRQVDVLGAPWLRAMCVIGSLRHLSQLEMISNNIRGTVAAFCTHDGELAVRQMLPLGGLRPADLDETLREVAQLAAFSVRRLKEIGA